METFEFQKTEFEIGTMPRTWTQTFSVYSKLYLLGCNQNPTKWHFSLSQRSSRSQESILNSSSPFSSALFPHIHFKLSLTHFLEHLYTSRVSQFPGTSLPKHSTTHLIWSVAKRMSVIHSNRVFPNCSNGLRVCPRKPRSWLFLMGPEWSRTRSWFIGRFGGWERIGDWRIGCSIGVKNGVVIVRGLVGWWYGYWGIVKSSVLLGVWFVSCIGLRWILARQCSSWLIGEAQFPFLFICLQLHSVSLLRNLEKMEEDRTLYLMFYMVLTYSE